MDTTACFTRFIVALWSIYYCGGQSTIVVVNLLLWWSIYYCGGQSTIVVVNLLLCWSIYYRAGQSTIVVVNLLLWWSIYYCGGQSTIVVVNLLSCWSIHHLLCLVSFCSCICTFIPKYWLQFGHFKNGTGSGPIRLMHEFSRERQPLHCDVIIAKTFFKLN